VNGICIESAGAGPPIVMLHGWAMHSGLFAPLLPRLVDRFRVLRVDLPGHGCSEPVSPYALDTIVAAIAGALEQSGTGGPLTLLGWSLGGTIALHWALVEPSRIGRLILTGATPCFVARPDWPPAMAATTLSRFGDELAASYRLTLQRFVALQVQGSEHARTVLAQLRSALFARGEPSREVLRAALELLTRTDLRREVAAIQADAAGSRRMAGACAAARDLPADPGRGARTVPLASRSVRLRNHRWRLASIHTGSIREACAAHSNAPPRRTTRQRRCSAKWGNEWPNASRW
jgi:pimeloyl-[acyl-carrier protein] methyl ester esterase